MECRLSLISYSGVRISELRHSLPTPSAQRIGTETRRKFRCPRLALLCFDMSSLSIGILMIGVDVLVHQIC